jgi:acyl carrier protein
MTLQPETLAAVRDCFQGAMSLSDHIARSIDERTTAADLPGWDSLSHLRLILALEARFAVRFKDDEVVEFVSVDAILRALEKIR